MTRTAASAAAPRSETRESDASRLGTGHGGREPSFVQSTPFERLSEAPNEVVRIRYDSYDNLLSMGIVHPYRPRQIQPAPEPFPDSAFSRYVPDPPGGG